MHAQRQNQLIAALKGGLPPTLPASTTIRSCTPLTRSRRDPARSKNGAVRPKTPLYQVVSIAISHPVSPPSIVPMTTERTMRTQINNALQGKGLTP